MEFTPDIYPDMIHLKAPVLIGFIFTSIMFGCITVALIQYFTFGYRTDSNMTRSLVIVLMTLASALMVHSIINTMGDFAVRYGLPPNRETEIWASTLYLEEGLIHVLVAGFYARRAWMMWGRPLWMILTLGLLILTTAAGAIGVSVVGYAQRGESMPNLQEALNLIMTISLVVGDLAITGLTTIKLLQTKSGWKQTDAVTKSLVVLGINAQGPPTIIATAVLITYAASPRKNYIFVFACLPLVYIFSLLLTLNSRYNISAKLGDASSSAWTQNRRNPPITSINVTTDTYIHADVADDMDIKQRSQVRGGGRGKLADSTESLQDHQDSSDLNTSAVRLV